MSGYEDEGTTDAKPEPTPSPDATVGTKDGDAGVGTAEEGPIEVGDDREKYVTVLERSGQRTEHTGVYLRHTTDEFVVSTDDSFPPAETTRLPKGDLLRVEISQHHSMCFITTATVGEGDTLDTLRVFRDDLRRTPAGRALVAIYYRVSPPIASTLRGHPNSLTTRTVRRFVQRSAAIAAYRTASDSRLTSVVLSLALVGVYVVGLLCALTGHLAIEFRALVAEREPGPS